MSKLKGKSEKGREPKMKFFIQEGHSAECMQCDPVRDKLMLLEEIGRHIHAKTVCMEVRIKIEGEVVEPHETEAGSAN